VQIRKLVARVLRRPGAILLVLLLGLLPMRAWSSGGDDPITIDRRADGLNSITWTASVAPSGRIAVRVHYDLDDTERTFDVRVPAGARYLAVDGDPTAADAGRFASIEIDGPVTITYELEGHVRRYRDGALVILAGAYGDEERNIDGGGGDEEEVEDDLTLGGDYGLFTCPRCYLDPIGSYDTPVFAALYAPGAAAGEALLNGLDPVRRDTPLDDSDNPDVIAFLGSDVDTGDVSMLAVIPAAAVPDVARSDGDVASAVADFRARFTDPDDQFRVAEPFDDAVDRWPAWILTALYGLLLLVLVGGPWWAGRTQRAARRAIERAIKRQGGGAEVPRLSGSSKPNDLSPAMAALVVNPAIDRKQSFVAATILDLARRRVITISSLDKGRFRIEIPAQLSTVSDFERAVLTQLRPLGVQPSPPKATEIVAPPVWHGRAPLVVRALGRALVKEGIRNKLIRRNRFSLLIVPIAIAMGIVALREVDGLAVPAWIAMILGTLVGLTTSVKAGTPLTAAGHEQRAIWSDYATWLSGNRDLRQAEAPDIEILGEVLVYGAALGAAPKAARALSPMPDGPP